MTYLFFFLFFVNFRCRKLVAEPPSSFKFVPEFVVEDLMAYIMWMIRFISFSSALYLSPSLPLPPHLRRILQPTRHLSPSLHHSPLFWKRLQTTPLLPPSLPSKSFCHLSLPPVLFLCLMFLYRVHPDMLIDAVSLEKFVRFAIHLIASPKYIRNPYLRSKLAGFLAEFVPKEGERAKLGTSTILILVVLFSSFFYPSSFVILIYFGQVIRICSRL